MTDKTNVEVKTLETELSVEELEARIKPAVNAWFDRDLLVEAATAEIEERTGYREARQILEKYVPVWEAHSGKRYEHAYGWVGMTEPTIVPKYDVKKVDSVSNMLTTIAANGTRNVMAAIDAHIDFLDEQGAKPTVEGLRTIVSTIVERELSDKVAEARDQLARARNESARKGHLAHNFKAGKEALEAEASEVIDDAKLTPAAILASKAGLGIRIER